MNLGELNRLIPAMESTPPVDDDSPMADNLYRHKNKRKKDKNLGEKVSQKKNTK